MQEAVDEEVRAGIASIIAHMRGGRGRKRRGGQELVRLLKAARSRAAGADEWQVVRLLQDSVDYAEDRILKPEFEERYRLFQDGARNEHLRKLAAGILSMNFGYVGKVGQEFLDAHPGASVEELITYIRQLSVEAKFLDAPPDLPGRYRILRGRAETAVWLERVLQDRVDIEDFAEAARRIVTSPDVLALLVDDKDGQIVFRAAELQRRSAGLATLRTAVKDPAASELDLQRALDGQHWIFGGRFVGQAMKRRLVPGDEIDIPLVRGDGALQIVELKRAMSLDHSLVKKHRNAWVPAGEVHDAVGQAVNYLVGLDENRQRVRDEFGIETRRASALVLIGHPALQPQVPEDEINETLRIFNTHLNRVEVLTYKELVDNAERSLGNIPEA